MIKFDSRGAEIVSSVPCELSTRLGRPPRETLFQQIQRMVMYERYDADNVIRDEADMMEDQLDFEDETDSEGLLMASPYDVADDIPDGFSASSYRENQKKKNSPNGGSSATAEPASVAGE